MKVSKYIEVFGVEETLRTLGLDKLLKEYKDSVRNGKSDKFIECQKRIRELRTKDMAKVHQKH